MKSLIKYVILSLLVFFMVMPISHAGGIVLCYSDTGHFEIELKLSERCFCCNNNSLQDKDTCFCSDIPISKEVDEHTTLLSNGIIQPKLQICLQTNTINLLNPSYHDGQLTSVNYLHLKSAAHESHRTIVLLI